MNIKNSDSIESDTNEVLEGVSPLNLTLISHSICPFVQRAVIVLKEKGIPFNRIDIDLNNKPDWFLKLSPLGKVPVLVVDDETVVFESAVITEYLDELSGGDLLSEDVLIKAKQRSWIEFASSLIWDIASLYSALDEKAFNQVRKDIEQKFKTLELNLSNEEYFGGSDLSLVDVSFGPALRYFKVFQSITEIDFFKGYQKVSSWQERLLQRQSVSKAVQPEYTQQLIDFVAKRDSYLGVSARTFQKTALAA